MDVPFPTKTTSSSNPEYGSVNSKLSNFCTPKLGVHPQGLQINSGEIIFQVDISIEIGWVATIALNPRHIPYTNGNETQDLLEGRYLRGRQI